MAKLTPLLGCPCGKVPPSLIVTRGNTLKWAFVSGGCCGEWHFEFRTYYHEPGSPECSALAQAAWNEAPRAN